MTRMSLMTAQGPDQATLSLGSASSAADRFSIRRLSIIGGVLANPGPHRIEINVSRHRPRSQTTLHDDTVKAILPKSPPDTVTLIEPTGVTVENGSDFRSSKSNLLLLLGFAEF